MIHKLFKNRVALNPELGRVRAVASAIVSHEQINKTKSVVFNFLMPYFQRILLSNNSVLDINFIVKTIIWHKYCYMYQYFRSTDVNTAKLRHYY